MNYTSNYLNKENSMFYDNGKLWVDDEYIKKIIEKVRYDIDLSPQIVQHTQIGQFPNEFIPNEDNVIIITKKIKI
jgi:hypothetical protein